MTALKKETYSPWIIFLFGYAVLFGPAFALFSEYAYDLQTTPDLATYLGLAEFDFDQSPVRRYRVIVPFLAAAIDTVLGGLFERLAPYTFPGPDFSLCFSFFVVNSLLMGLFGLVVYRLAQACGAGPFAAAIGLLSVLTSRWTAYLAGLPLVDSLYALVIATTLLSMAMRNHRLLIASMLIGPWAKESYVFMVPLLFLYAPMRWYQTAGWLALSGLLVFSFRFGYDWYHQLPPGESLSDDLAHLQSVGISLRRLFSFHGLYEVVSIVGVWGLLFLLLLKKEVRAFVGTHSPEFSWLFVGIIVLHALLSTELARMLYLLAPLLAVWIGLIVEQLTRRTKLQLR
mgnify:CR=1 FL=1